MRERVVDRSIFLDLFSGMNFPSGTCFVMVKIAFQNPPIEWKRIRWHLHRRESSLSGSTRRRLGRKRTEPGSQTQEGIEGNPL